MIQAFRSVLQCLFEGEGGEEANADCLEILLVKILFNHSAFVEVITDSVKQEN
jgi:hypothetical protein